VAQQFKDLQTPETPLVLKAKGSFFVGGETVEQSFVELGSRGPADQITINQMYVEYMLPDGTPRVPVVMVHGATLSGKTYDTTPDGRMGWFEYFVRQAHPVYVADQVGRARSGFNQAVFNNVRAGSTPPSAQPNMFRLADRFGAWTSPAPGVPFAGTQFPVDAAGELSKQGIPDLIAGLPSPNPTFKALSDLAIQLNGAVLLSHSQSGSFPLEAALINSDSIRGMVLAEPGNCGATVYTDQQIATLAKVPILVVFGDHLSSPTGVPGPNWQDRFNDCQAFIARVGAANGNAQMLYPPDLGIHGNSHMIMQDKNNLQIADLIRKWINESVRQASTMKLRITAGDKVIMVTLIDSETTQDFVSLLPLTLTMNDLFGREKFGHLPRAIAEGGKRTRTYEVGDVIYWSPGPDVAMFYRQDGQSIPSPGIIVMGKIDSGVEALNVLGSVNVTIELMEKQAATIDGHDRVTMIGGLG
jgi:pimeloyl-ACP methyl ester carboxylesterase